MDNFIVLQNSPHEPEEMHYGFNLKTHLQRLAVFNIHFTQRHDGKWFELNQNHLHRETHMSHNTSSLYLLYFSQIKGGYSCFATFCASCSLVIIFQDVKPCVSSVLMFIDSRDSFQSFFTCILWPQLWFCSSWIYLENMGRKWKRIQKDFWIYWRYDFNKHINS